MKKFIGFVHTVGKNEEFEWDNYELQLVSDGAPDVTGFSACKPEKLRAADAVKLLKCTHDEIDGVLIDNLDKRIIIETTERPTANGSFRKAISSLEFI